MKDRNRIPVLVGIGQLVNKDTESAGEPLEYMAECARKAADDMGARDILSKIDSLSVVNVISRKYVDPPLKLAEMLGAKPSDKVTTPIGATAPQGLTNRLCDRISKGESEIGLICGAEAFHSGKGKPDLSASGGGQNDSSTVQLFGDMRPPLSKTEIKYGLVMPSVVYPLFANAYRQAQGLSLDENLLQIGKFCEKYAKVAVDNEYAWFRDGKNADLISTVTPDNRMITYPYTKFMNAIMNVDQAAALIVMSDEKADSLGIPQEKRVYLIGCGDASDKWLVSNRVNYHSAPGLEIAFSNAFRQAEVDKSEINQWDFYNCFPVPAQVAVQTLGLPDSVVPTVVGGLPYFGGPGNNYTLHAICGMVERLRENPEQKGLVQALSWFMSKYSVGIYSGIRPEKFQRRDPAEYMYEVDELYPDVVVLTGAGGTFEIETYTVSVNREGEPESAVVIARNENRERLFALNVDDRALMTSMTQEEPIGKNVRISYDESTGMHRFADIF